MSAVVVWDPSLLRYDFGAGHPLAPVRVELAVELMRACGLLEPAPGGRRTVAAPVMGEERRLLAHHTHDYVATVKRLSRGPAASAASDARTAAPFGLGPGDTPAFPGAHDAALAVCAATATAADLVVNGHVPHAFNPAGGLHHAMPGRAAGFCVYNDVAAGIDALLEAGVERIAYIDVDVHHGDGVEVMFADDPRVMTVSIHESPEHLFPGTGRVDDIGRGPAAGTVVNLPLHPGTTGDVWMEVFEAVVEPVVEAFAPEVLVTQLGCDAHYEDPLAHLSLTIDDFAAIYRRLHELAHALTDGRWVATGGGGYALARVVPRAWTLALAEMREATLPVDIPMVWREMVATRGLGRAPDDFTDDRVDQTAAMRATTRRVAEAMIAAARQLHARPMRRR